MHFWTNLIICIALNLAYSKMSGADILYFNKDCNVDLAGADETCADERFNLLNIISNEGHSVSLLASFNEVNLAQILDEHDFLLIPDMEDAFGDCAISDADFLSIGAQEVMNQYVHNGGSILIAGSSQNIEFLNLIFDLNLQSNGVVNVGTSLLNIDQVAGTVFSDCPIEIPNLSATFLITTSMPAGKLCVYESNGGSSLAYFPVGNGSITYLGFDFFDAGPGCIQETSLWNGCALESAIITAQFGPAGIPVPALSEWLVIILLLLLMIFSCIAIRNADYLLHS